MIAALPILALAAVGASASPVGLERRVVPASSRNVTTNGTVCSTFTAPVSATAMNINLASVLGGKPANQQAVTQDLINMFAAGSTVSSQIMNASRIPVNGSYPMSFTYCQPTGGATQRTILQAIHGLVGNAAYWNNGLVSGTGSNATLSFQQAVAQSGYASLAYDRLCVGNSSLPDGTGVCQITYEAAQAVAISQMLRSGALGVGSWNSVAAVGHSYGSILLAGVASTAPTAFDALVLTGFSSNVTMGPLGVAGFSSTIANTVNATAFPNNATDYWVTPTQSADHMGFFHYPGYAPRNLDAFTATKGQYTLGQTYSIAGPYSLSRANFTRPVHVVTGSDDGPFCAGNCSITSLGANMTQLDSARASFPSVAMSNFTTYVVPQSGHGINFHNAAPQAYASIVSFLRSHTL